MKSLFVVAVATGIFTGTSFELNAQANINLEKLAAKPKTAAPKFISNIEITPSGKPTDGDYYSTEAASMPAVAAAPQPAEATETPKKTSIALNSMAIEKCNALQFKYAMLMDVEVETVTNFVLLNFIEEWWATRYRYGGTDKKGIDCSSFTGKLQQEVYNNSMPRTARDQYQVCEKVELENLQEGDLVFFNTRGGVSHVGVYLGNSCFVHSSTNSGVTISSLTDSYYSKRYIGGGRATCSTAKK
jgi:cell wall-associated NlpC family hydrolase